MSSTETSWDDVLDGLDLPSHNGDKQHRQHQTPASSPTPDEPAPAPDPAPSVHLGYTDKGERSPLIRTRRADLVWFLTAPVVKVLAAIATLALAGGAIMLYAVPSVDAWWQEQTNPEPAPLEPQEPVVIDGDPVLYGVEDVEVDFDSEFDLMDGVRALDPEDGDITEDIEVRGEVDTGVSGDQTIRYGIEDSAGNTAHHWRTISVGEEPEPEPEDEEEEEEPEPEPSDPSPTQTPTQAPQPTQPPPAPAPSPTPTQRPTQPPAPQPTQPPTPVRVSQSDSLSCTGDVTITFHASGGGNVVLSGSVSGSGSGSVSASTSVSGGGTVTATATADGSVNIANEWAGTGSCN